MPDIDAQLEALADHRVENIPDEVVTAEIEPEPTTARRSAWVMGVPIRRLAGIAAALVLIGGIVLIVKATDGADLGKPAVRDLRISMNERQLIARSDWTQPLTAGGHAATFALARTGEGFDTIEVAVPERAKVPFLPASTFKILNALIILETGTLPDVDTKVPWDGVTREFEVWNQDHSLRTGLQVSAVWAFQELARQVGDEAMAALVSAADYGNSDISGGIDVFWLEGALRTSAIDQLDFLERLALDKLPFDPAHQAAVRDILVVEDGPDWRIRYKTGTALKPEPALGWLVGMVDTDDGQWVFAYNVDLSSGDGDLDLLSTRDWIDLVVELLESAAVIAR